MLQSLVKDTAATLLEVKLQEAKETIEYLRSELREVKSVPLKENRMDKKRYSKRKYIAFLLMSIFIRPNFSCTNVLMN